MEVTAGTSRDKCNNIEKCSYKDPRNENSKVNNLGIFKRTILNSRQIARIVQIA